MCFLLATLQLEEVGTLSRKQVQKELAIRNLQGLGKVLPEIPDRCTDCGGANLHSYNGSRPVSLLPNSTVVDFVTAIRQRNVT